MVIRISRLVQDITEQKSLEDALSATDVEYRSLVTALAEGVVVFSNNGQVLKNNVSAERILGLSASEFKKLSLKDPRWNAVYEDGSVCSPEALSDLLFSRVDEGLSNRILGLHRPDGALVWLLMNARSLIRSGETAPYGFVVSFADITQQKQAELALRESQERLVQLNRHLEQQVTQRTEELRKKDEELYQARKLEAVGRLAGGVAHDFNNLITGIAGIAEELKETLPIGDPRHHDLSEMVQATQRAFSLIRQLLAFGRRQITHPQTVNINSVIRNFSSLLQRLIGEDIQMQMQLGDIRLVKIDPNHLEQVLMNLLLNARDAMPQGGSILIRTATVDLSADDSSASTGAASRPPRVLIEISDTGCGMDEETITHIFEPFFTTKLKEKGNGLGLATVYGVIKQNGGEILVDSRPGTGTTFQILLPIETEGVLVKDEAFESNEPARTEPSSVVSKTILVVEDEDIVRRVLVRRLRQAGYRVLEAGDGKQALKLNEEHGASIDLVITDVVMPEMNGRDVVAHIHRQNPGVSVLYISGYPEEIIARRGVLEPGINFMEKSALVDDLYGKVQEALRQPHSQPIGSSTPT